MSANLVVDYNLLVLARTSKVCVKLPSLAYLISVAFVNLTLTVIFWRISSQRHQGNKLVVDKRL